MSFVVRLGITWATILLFLSAVSFYFITPWSAEFYVLLASGGLILTTLVGLLLVAYADWNPFEFVEPDG
ncbi:hypothetical protein [Halomontanus rarus]|uniref:hypothetical protein n=1 Tax=Halomontanus rarus TaxID=3034020 RepID=UPI00293B99EA|nr:hypothetical protein [Halovivax sp. KZCA124]